MRGAGQPVASVEECRESVQKLGRQLSELKNASKLNQSLSVTVSDLGVAFLGQLVQGRLTDGSEVAAPAPKAKINLECTSDDLVALANGVLSFPSAFASGRLRVRAGLLDMLALRSLGAPEGT